MNPELDFAFKFWEDALIFCFILTHSLAYTFLFLFP